jgi:uncharacterized phage infection (PIP) family protein YhgE
MTTTLDQEKFDTMKALADMQTALSEGQAELLKVKEATEEYMVVREEEAEERVLKVLKESRDALDETSKNHTELSNYSRDLKAYATELKVIATDITALFKDFRGRMNTANKVMDERSKEASQILKQAKVERIQIAEDRKQLAIERRETEEGFRLLKDKRDTLDRAINRLKEGRI